MMLNATQKESSNSDVRLRSNRRPKFLLVNSFQQVNRVLALLRSVALFDSKLHIQDDVKCNYSQKMNARAQRARRSKKRINSFRPTSQREIALQNGYTKQKIWDLEKLRGWPSSGLHEPWRDFDGLRRPGLHGERSEEHTSELQSRGLIS